MMVFGIFFLEAFSEKHSEVANHSESSAYLLEH